MEQVRLDSSINFHYSIYRYNNGKKIRDTFSGKNASIKFINKETLRELPFDIVKADDEIHAVIQPSKDNKPGVYSFVITYTLGGEEMSVDFEAFDMLNEYDYANIDSQQNMVEIEHSGIIGPSGLILIPSVKGNRPASRSISSKAVYGAQSDSSGMAHEIELRKTPTSIDWKRTNETVWHPIIRISELMLHFCDLSKEDIHMLWNEIPADLLESFKNPAKKAAEDLLLKYDEFVQSTEQEINDFEAEINSMKEEVIAYFRDLTNRANNVIADLNKAIKNTTDGEIKRTKAEAERKSNEERRIESETKRESSENERKTAEGKRATEESKRVSGEHSRNTAEAERKRAEEERVGNENNRIAAERDRSIAEKTRRDDEINRIKNEEWRQDNIGKGLKAMEDATWFAKSVQDNPGFIGDDYHVYIWSVQRQEYVKTERILRPDGFKVEKIYSSTMEMERDFHNLSEGDFVSVVTGGQSKIYMRAFDSFVPINTNYGLTKNKIEEVFTGDIQSHNHKTQMDEALSGYQKKEEGKGLSTNDYTAEDKQIVSNIEETIMTLIDQYADVITYTTDEEYENMDEWDPKKVYVTTNGSYLQSIYIGRFLIATRGDQPAPEGFPYSLPIIF